MRRLVVALLCVAACGGNPRSAATEAPPVEPVQPTTTSLAIDGRVDEADRLVARVEPSTPTLEPDLSIVLPPADPEASGSGTMAVVIDNSIDDGEWRPAERYAFDGSIRRLWLGAGEGMLVVRVDFSDEVLGDRDAGFDLYVGGSDGTDAPGLTPGGTFLGFEASRVVSWRGLDPVVVSNPRDYDGSNVAAPGVLPAGFDGTSIEFAVPLAALPDAAPGERLTFRIVDVSGGPERAVLPAGGPAVLVIPPPGT